MKKRYIVGICTVLLLVIISLSVNASLKSLNQRYDDIAKKTAEELIKGYDYDSAKKLLTTSFDKEGEKLYDTLTKAQKEKAISEAKDLFNKDDEKGARELLKKAGYTREEINQNVAKWNIDKIKKQVPPGKDKPEQEKALLEQKAESLIATGIPEDEGLARQILTQAGYEQKDVDKKIKDWKKKHGVNKKAEDEARALLKSGTPEDVEKAKELLKYVGYSEKEIEKSVASGEPKKSNNMLRNIGIGALVLLGLGGLGTGGFFGVKALRNRGNKREDGGPPANADTAELVKNTHGLEDVSRLDDGTNPNYRDIPPPFPAATVENPRLLDKIGGIISDLIKKKSTTMPAPAPDPPVPASRGQSTSSDYYEIKKGLIEAITTLSDVANSAISRSEELSEDKKENKINLLKMALNNVNQIIEKIQTNLDKLLGKDKERMQEELHNFKDQRHNIQSSISELEIEITATKESRRIR